MSPSQPARRNRFYWFEGVTRNEVERSLHDRAPSILRRQTARRLLVAANALVIVALALSAFIMQPKLKSYGEMALMTLAISLYLALRKSIRHISDAPNEMLDERQVAIRDAGYTVAYRTLALAGVAYTVLGFAVAPDSILHDRTGPHPWVSLVWSYMMCCASLPATVLAWQLPNESQSDAP